MLFFFVFLNFISLPKKTKKKRKARKKLVRAMFLFKSLFESSFWTKLAKLKKNGRVFKFAERSSLSRCTFLGFEGFVQFDESFKVVLQNM